MVYQTVKFFQCAEIVLLTPDNCAEEILYFVWILSQNTVFMHGVVLNRNVRSPLQPYSMSRLTVSHIILVLAS